jgi:hypothetical protein
MDYSIESLKKKLLEIHCEINQKGLSLDIEYDDRYNSWVITFSKGNHRRHALLDKKDADECMIGKKCIYFWGIIDQYANILEEEISLNEGSGTRTEHLSSL